MKKILFTLFLLLTLNGGAWAQEAPDFIVSNPSEVKVGATGSIVLTLARNGVQCRDMQFDVTIPKGFEYVDKQKPATVAHSVGHNVTLETETEVTHRFVLSDNDAALLPDGEFLQIILKDNGGEGHEEGAEFDAKITNIIISQNKITDGQASVGDTKIDRIDFKIKLVEDVIHLYEDYAGSESQIKTYQGDVRVHRTLKPNQWNTIVLPFDMDADQLQSAFGSNVKVGIFTGTTYDEATNKYTIQFQSTDEIYNNTPCIIKVSGTEEDYHSELTNNTLDESGNIIDFKVLLVDMALGSYGDDPDEVKLCNKKSSRKEHFKGTYKMKTVKSEGETAYLAGGKFYYLSDGNSTTVKAFRGYFELYYLPDYIETIEESNSNSANLAFSIDDEQITDIDGVTTSTPVAEGVYDLQGRKVSNDLNTLKRGVYIIDGKKVMVK